MAPRPLTDAAVLKQLKAVGQKLARQRDGEKRLVLLRRQAELGDQRDTAADKARQAARDADAQAGPPTESDRGSYWTARGKDA